ncbi:MAG: long-chain-acyl-CoA synthetase [Beijerinckiaceae bacterium]|nr:long-chain-acyl-CoA synthetase [Beijerinckiaceae bacterium]
MAAAPSTAAARGAVSASAIWTRALQRTAGITDDQTVLLADVVDAHAACAAGAPALLADRGSLTYGALAQRSNQVARWAMDRGLKTGDTVCLMLPNSPDYLAIWLGLSRVGIVTALLNTQITGASLAHCIAIAGARIAIVDSAWLDIYRTAAPEGEIWVHGGARAGVPRLEPSIETHASGPLDEAARAGLTLRDPALLIYTSGTTGLPKAARVSHYRIRMWSEWFAGLMEATPNDRLYNCLPMYHSIGGVAAVGAMLAAGGAVVVREKFSASRFWDEVAAWDCTIFQYIGELCRYLVNQPARAMERAHRLRLCCGNGLRADIWDAFRSRFAIPRLLEFYAATEGSFSLFNVEEQPGAIGKIPGFMAHRSPVALVRFDLEAGVPARTPEGFCLRCEPGEPGEALGRLAQGEAGLSTRFEGYTNRAETEGKVLRDVFEKGDAWFRTGDLMRKDRKGFYYFVDRAGDTFRWKGENVATQEVEAVLCRYPGVREANVYGVAIPGMDGRAGMAAVVADPSIDLTALHAHLQQNLPAFARPLFLRLRGQMAVTGTFKHQKQALIGEGYDPATVADPLYLNDTERCAFVALDAALHSKIATGSPRL